MTQKHIHGISGSLAILDLVKVCMWFTFIIKFHDIRILNHPVYTHTKYIDNVIHILNCAYFKRFTNQQTVAIGKPSLRIH